MAIFYGLAESEKELLKKYPDKISKIDDVPKALDQIEQELQELDQ